MYNLTFITTNKAINKNKMQYIQWYSPIINLI